MTQVLKVICDTYLKMRPASVMDLSEQEELFVKTGSIFEVVSLFDSLQEFDPTNPDSDFAEYVQEFDPTNRDSDFGEYVPDSMFGEGVGGMLEDVINEVFGGGTSFGEGVGGMSGDVIDLDGTSYAGFGGTSGESIGEAITVAAGHNLDLSYSYNPTQSAPVQNSSTIDLELQKLTSGKVLFDTPDYMKVGITERISVRIVKTITQDFLEGLAHSQEAKIENIRISRYMIVNLRGDDFKVEALGNEEQIIEDHDFTQWDWKVVPLKSGNRKLWVSITIQIKAENEQGRKTLPILEKEIPVKINPIYSTNTFVSQYWQWLIASAIIPIVGLLLKK